MEMVALGWQEWEGQQSKHAGNGTPGEAGDHDCPARSAGDTRAQQLATGTGPERGASSVPPDWTTEGRYKGPIVGSELAQKRAEERQVLKGGRKQGSH